MYVYLARYQLAHKKSSGNGMTFRRLAYIAPLFARAVRSWPMVLPSPPRSALLTPSRAARPPFSATLDTPTVASPIPTALVARTALPEPHWRDLSVPPTELRITASLATGQCFNWRPIEFAPPSSPPSAPLAAEAAPSSSPTPAWVGVLGRRVVALRETPTTTLFACLARGGDGPSSSSSSSAAAAVPDAAWAEAQAAELAAELRDYFQLETPLGPLVAAWAAADPRLKVLIYFKSNNQSTTAVAPWTPCLLGTDAHANWVLISITPPSLVPAPAQVIAGCLPGLRVMRQDPAECLLSFIVSSNNNISRIALILNRLRRSFGEHLLTLPAAAATETPVAPSSSVNLFTAVKHDNDDEGSGSGNVDGNGYGNGEGNGEAALSIPSPGSGLAKRGRKPAVTQTAGAAAGEQAFFGFPSLRLLAAASEEELRSLGLGYRARFVKETAAALLIKGGAGSKVTAGGGGGGGGGGVGFGGGGGGAGVGGDRGGGGGGSIGGEPSHMAAVKPEGAEGDESAAAANVALVWNPLSSGMDGVGNTGGGGADGGGGAAVELGARAWLAGLRDHSRHSRQDVQRELMAFTGVGQKVRKKLFLLDTARYV